MSRALSKTERIRRALDRAELALRGFLTDEALSHVAEVLRLSPGNAEARLLEARVQMHRNDPRQTLNALDAHDHYESCDNDAGPERPDAMLMRAASLARLGQLNLALTQLERLADFAPADVRVLQALATLQAQAGHEQDAIDTLTLLTSLDPADHVSARLLSDLLSPHDPSAAVAALGRIESGDRRRAAQNCRRAGRLLDAERHYAALLEEQPDEAATHRAAAELAMEMGEMARAEDRLRAALLLTGRSAASSRPAWVLLAEQWMRRGRVIAAGRAWWRAIRADATSLPRAWAGLLTCALRAGRPALMRRADRALRSLVTRAERRALLAELWFQTVPPRFAEPGGMNPARSEPEEPSPLDAVLAQAESVLAEQAERFPERADVRYHHGAVLAAQSKCDDAQLEVTAALEINPAYRAAQELQRRLTA